MSNTPAGNQRLIIDEDSWTVDFDGVRYEVNHLLALQVFKRIATSRGQYLSDEHLSQIPGCRGGSVRFDRLLKHLPLELRALIVSKPGPGGGYALKLPPKGEPELESTGRDKP